MRASVPVVAETEHESTAAESSAGPPTGETPGQAPQQGGPKGSAAVASRVAAVFGWMRRHAYLALVMAAVLVLTRTIDFSPPEQVRVGKTDVARIVGDAPSQEFSQKLSNPQAVQVRATLRLYPDNELKVAGPDPEMDDQGKLLSQPVVTTILGMNATVEQTVRLEDGDLEVDLQVNATPRVEENARKGKAAPPLVVETQIEVSSRRRMWWTSKPERRVHLNTQAFLSKIEESGHRVVFTVDGHLFSLDLEVHRPLGAGATLAGSG